MKDGYRRLADNARKRADGYDEDARKQMIDGTGAEAQKFKHLAAHQRSEAKVYDREGAKL